MSRTISVVSWERRTGFWKPITTTSSRSTYHHCFSDINKVLLYQQPYLQWSVTSLTNTTTGECRSIIYYCVKSGMHWFTQFTARNAVSRWCNFLSSFVVQDVATLDFKCHYLLIESTSLHFITLIKRVQSYVFVAVCKL